MIGTQHVDAVTAGKNLVTAALFVPLRQRRRHMHLLNDVPRTDAGVIGTERNLALLRRVRNDATFRSAEIVVEEILKPHAGDEQEVPAIAATFLDVMDGSVTRDLAVVAAGSAPGLVELLQKIDKPEVLRRHERIVVLHQRQRHSGYR